MFLKRLLALTLFAALAVMPPCVLRAQWQRLPDPPGAIALNFAQTSSGIIVAGTNNGVWLSSDHMSSWSSAGMQGRAVPVIVSLQDSAGNNVLYATDDSLLYRSSDLGTTWNSIVSPFRGGMLTYGNELIVWNFQDTANCVSSTFDGILWTSLGTAPPIGTEGFTLGVGAGTIIGAEQGSGIWSMPLSGGSWTQIPYPGDSEPNCLQVSDSMIVVGENIIYYSTDLGQTWITPANKGLSTINEGIVSFAMMNGTIIANCNYGIVRSDDSAKTWTSVFGTGGYPNYHDGVYGEGDGAEINFVDGSFVSGEAGGIFRSTDGVSWQFASHGMTYYSVGDIATLADTLFACVNGAVFQSTTQGQTWNDEAQLENVSNFTNVKGILFALTNNNLLWRYSNGNWKSSACPADLALAMVDSTLFGCRWDELLISHDTGATWRQVLSGNQIDWLQYIYAFGDTLFALPNVGQAGWPLYSSIDHGNSWKFVDTFPTQGGFFDMPAAQDSSDLLIYNYRMMNFSTDHGFDWLTIDNHDATFIKTWNNQFFVGLTSYFGLSDAEPNWCGLFKLRGSELVQILPDTATSTMQGFAADDQFAYISTASKGIWATDVSNPSLSVKASRPNISTSPQIYPNHFTQSTQITFTSQAAGYAEVSIMNMLGVEVARLFSGELGAGEHSFTWDADKNACATQGAYECLVRMNGQVETLPVVLMR
jgi:hypothetical protein